MNNSEFGKLKKITYLGCHHTFNNKLQTCGIEKLIEYKYFCLKVKKLMFQNYLDKIYPDYAQALGWIIVCVPLSAIVICAIGQTIKYRNNLVINLL